MDNYDYLFKLILIGDSSVGKSCLLQRFIDDEFREDSDPTIGVEFGSRVIKSTSGIPIRLQVWDTAGQENFRAITQTYYKGAIGAMVVFDVTEKETFENVTKWIQDAKNYCSSYNFEMVLVGNKMDDSLNR